MPEDPPPKTETLKHDPKSAWTDEGVKRMKKLKDAQDKGQFDQEFDRIFPPEKPGSAAPTSTKQEPA